MDERFVKRLMANMKCGVCGQRYESPNVHILGHRDDLWFVGVFCPSCRSQGLVAAVIKEGKVPEFISELSEAEQEKFLKSGIVGADDVLEMHDFLKNFNGNFTRLFPHKK